MKVWMWVLGAVGVVAVVIVAAVLYLGTIETRYQRDADAKRVADTHRIAVLLEEYRQANGHYPYFERLATRRPPEKDVLAVIVASTSAEEQLAAENADFRRDPFGIGATVYHAEELDHVLSTGLKRPVSLPVDPQKASTGTPDAYLVFFGGEDGYLVMSFLNKPNSFTATQSPKAHIYAVASGPNETFLSGIGLRPRIFSAIDPAETARLLAAGDRSDAIFRNSRAPVTTADH